MSRGSLTAPRSRVRRAVIGVVIVAAFLTGAVSVPQAASAQSPAAPAPSVTLPSGASKYSPGPIMRLADTRTGTGYSVIDPGFYGVKSTIRINISNRTDVPANVVAAVVNVAFVRTGGAGFVTVFPSGTSLPTASNVSSDSAGRTVANLVTVKVGSGGNIDLYRHTFGDVAVDLVGVYVTVGANPRDGRFVPIPVANTPRVLDTRTSGGAFSAAQTRSVSLASSGIPSDVAAVVVNLTAVDANAGFWTAFQTGTTRGDTSNLNIDAAPQTRAVQAIVPMDGTNKSMQVYSHKGGHLVVDVAGWFTTANASNSSDGVFVPNTPASGNRFDTRNQQWLAPWAKSTFEFNPRCNTGVVGAAAAINVTATSPWDNGFVTAYPAGADVPTASTLNINKWPQTIANHAIVGISSSSRGVALYTHGGAHIIADVAGCYLGTQVSPRNAKPSNPNYRPSPVTYVSVNTPKFVSNLPAGYSSDPEALADYGLAGTWTDTANLAAAGNVMLFAHRTSAGGPFRNLHLLPIGSTYTLRSADGRTYYYRVMELKVTLPNYSDVIARAAPFGQITSQLVACTKLNMLPTSTDYRLVATGRLYKVV